MGIFRLGTVIGLLLLAGPGLLAQNGLKIVVISGEDSVNVIQQGTAVAPVVEVRDRNDEPVGAAIVTFTVRNARSATFQGGARTATTVTDAAGRATATVNPTGQGQFQIQVRATFRGQTATTNITQTNVASSGQGNAAQSGGSGGGGAAGAAGAAAAASSSGGLVGGLVTAGAFGAFAVSREIEARDSRETPAFPRQYAENYSFQGTVSVSRPGFATCPVPYAETGTIAMTMESVTDGAYSGTATIYETDNTTATSCPFGTPPFTFPTNSQPPLRTFTGRVSGSAERLEFSASQPFPSGRIDVSFVGAIQNGTVVGTYTKRQQQTFTQGTPTGPVQVDAVIDLTVPVTLR